MTTAARRRRARAPSPPFWRRWTFLGPAVVVPVVLAWVVAVVFWPPASLLAGGLALLALVLVARRLRLSRSLIFYELLRSARRDRNLLFRCLYACLLLGVLCWFYMSWFGDPLLTVLTGQRGIAPGQMPRFAEHFFTTFLTAQMATVLLVTPIYTAGVIAEEKERRTLEFLLATHLSSGEIVLSKLTARLVNLVLLLLAGLPVLALTQLWGGVDPLLLAGGFAVTGVTMLSVASVGVLNSVYARNSLDAVLRTYGVCAVFLTVGTCIPGANWGHPVWMLEEMSVPVSWGRWSAADVMLVYFIGYMIIHLGVTAACLSVAVGRLRAVALLPPPSPVVATRRAAPVPASAPPGSRPPRLADSALLWKELYGEGMFRWNRSHPILARLLLLYGACAAVGGFAMFFTGALDTGHVLGLMNVWARASGTLLGCLFLLPVVIHAARTVSRERERQTLDSLRSVPEDASAILFAKWLGSFCSTRNAWWYLGALWVLGTITGGLVPLALPLLALAWGVYLGFVAAVGLYWSTVCRTSLRATLATAVTLLAVVAAPWVLWDLGPLLLPRGGGGAWLVSFQHDGLTPPMPLWVLAFGYGDLFHAGLAAWAARVLAALAGLACYAGAGWLLWRRALARLRAEP